MVSLHFLLSENFLYDNVMFPRVTPLRGTIYNLIAVCTVGLVDINMILILQ